MSFYPYQFLKKHLSIGFVCKIFLPWVVLFFIGYAVFEKTEDLSSNNKDNKNLVNSVKDEVKPQEVSNSQVVFKDIEKKIASSVDKNAEEWCEPLPYSDLSKHQSIVDFNNWLNRFVEYKCFE